MRGGCFRCCRASAHSRYPSSRFPIDLRLASVGSTSVWSRAQTQALASDSSRGAERPAPTRWPISCSAIRYVTWPRISGIAISSPPPT